MPGLIGMTCGTEAPDACAAAVTRMRGLMTHPRFGEVDAAWNDRLVAAARVHTGRLAGPTQPASRHGLVGWLDGEIVNARGLVPGEPGAEPGDAGVLLELLARDDPGAALRAADGSFAGAVYEPGTGVVRLVSDRFGLRPLYWLVHRDRLVWASTLAALLALPGFIPRIAQRTVDEFLTCGHPVGDHTLFEGVRLLDSGTVLTFGQRGEVSLERYWWWDRVRPAGASRLDEAADELGRRLRRAVEERAPADQRVGVSLSGGLDSRALLAAVPERPILPAVTFGRAGCVDVAIAAKVAALKGAVHHVAPLTQRGWLAPRLEGVWWTDGQFNIVNMHGIEAADVYREVCDAHLDGYGGDFILGGMYMGDSDTWGRFSPELVARRMKAPPGSFGPLAPWDALDRSDYYLIENRARRMNNAGTRVMQGLVQERKPLLDGDVVEFALGLPDAWRANGRLYRRMLLRAFPEYYRRIPWASIGVPISWPRGVRRIGKTYHRRDRRGDGTMRAFGLPGRYYVRYADYAAWLRLPPARGFIESLLRAPDALYPEYTSRSDVLRLWDEHLAGADRAVEVGRRLTLEIWLQQVFAERLRPWSEPTEELR